MSTPYLSQKPAEENVLVNTNSDIVPRSRSRQKPTAAVHIPDVGREHGSWRGAVEQWDEGNPDMPQGLALKDWPREWYTKGMTSVMGVKRSQCKLISDEYTRFGRDDEKFLRAYPFADTKPLMQLLQAIPEEPPR